MTRPQINVTPLIDVLLVLLIIFMVVTPMKPSAFQAKIPSEPENNPYVGTDPRTIVITIKDDSTLRLNKDDLSASVDDPKVLVEHLQSIFEQRAQNLVYADDRVGEAPRIEKTVFVKAPRGLDYGSVAKVVDALKIAGASPVSLQIDNLD